MITGNHDAWYKDTSEINSLSILKGYSNITVYDKLTTVNINNKTITFCPWGCDITKIPASDIIIGHFELSNFKVNAFKICDDGLDPYQLLKKAPLIFSGHFHIRDDKQFIKEKSRIVYVGNPFEMDFGDSGDLKGFYVLDLSTFKYEFIGNNITPRHIKIQLSNLISMGDGVVTFFSREITNNIIKLIIDRNISIEHLDLLVSKIASYSPRDLRVDYDVNYNKVRFESKDKLDLSSLDIPQAIEDFINMLDISNKKNVVNYTVNLYNRSKDRSL